MIQPTTLFGRFKGDKSTLIWDGPSATVDELKDVAAVVDPVSGVSVDASCNTTITIKCLQQIYNAVGYVPSADVGNSIGITGYLEEFANIQDLQVSLLSMLHNCDSHDRAFVSYSLQTSARMR